MITKAIVLSALASVAAAVTHNVIVGGLNEDNTPKLVFEPNYVNAVVGDVVRFEFHQKNHSVVQTSFGNVCKPLVNAQNVPVFRSDFYPVDNTTSTFEAIEYTVADASKPLWFYCSQKNHCGKGMVFSINCPTGDAPNSLDNFIQSALEFGAQEAAGASWSATATSDVYGGQTYAPVYHPTVTDIITLDQTSIWTTTYESYANSPNATPVSAEGVVHEITVGGNGGLTYDPPSIAANVRDTIRFKFVAKNHTATQSSFREPCRKLEFTSTTGQKGFDSGFAPVADANSPITYDIIVNDTAPIWVYCRQGNHCGQGMVFSVNADESSDRNFAAFQALARTLNGTGAAPSQGGIYGNVAVANVPALSAVFVAVMVGFGSMVSLLL